jgi:hypothetical protein
MARKEPTLQWLGRLEAATSAERRGVADLGPDRVGVFFVREVPDGEREVRSLMDLVRACAGLRAGAIVSMSGATMPTLNEHEILRLAESLLAGRTHGQVEHLSIRSEPWSADLPE